ncbi:MAG: quaternary ammonium transporter [Cyanobacteria bacterium RM1_2_2]|nr:quaternary ammonium transporter [Cyanobacteria bacterium RM1_2_2]
MKRVRHLIILPLLALLTATILIACAGGGNTTSGSSPIKVGSKDFTEAFIIGEMYALALEKAGFQVERKLNLGGTPVAHAALQSGEIDLYPEYTGTGLLTILKEPAISDQQQVYNKVAAEYQERYNLVWLEPAPMNNTQALAMTRAASEKFGIRTFSDLAAKANQLVMVGPPEFEVREDGLPGIKAKYGGFELKEYKAVDPGLRYKALNDEEADVSVAFGTDGEIAAFDLVVLEDDQQLFPPYQVAPVVRQQTIDANPAIVEALNTVAPKLDNATMQKLNYEVSGKQREPAEVAKEFLTEAGLL